MSTAVNILRRRNETPREDWNAIKRSIRYLNRTRNFNLINVKIGRILKTYVDADWPSDINTRKFTSGNLFLVGKSPIQRVSKRQTCVTLSSAEAE